jgi:hypothetical protein
VYESKAIFRISIAFSGEFQFVTKNYHFISQTQVYTYHASPNDGSNRFDHFLRLSHSLSECDKKRLCCDICFMHRHDKDAPFHRDINIQFSLQKLMIEQSQTTNNQKNPTRVRTFCFLGSRFPLVSRSCQH